MVFDFTQPLVFGGVIVFPEAWFPPPPLYGPVEESPVAGGSASGVSIQIGGSIDNT